MNNDDLFKRIFGTHRKKLVRTNDPDTSHAAAASVNTTDLERMVYEAICKYQNG